MESGFEGCSKFLQEGPQNNSNNDNSGEDTFDRHRINRFWIGSGEKSKGHTVIMLDDEPKGAHMHHYPLPLNSKKYGNWIPCPKRELGASECFFCDNDSFSGPRRTVNFTILNAEGFTDSDGNHRMGIEILPANDAVFGQIAEVKKEHGRVSGAVFEATRYSDNSSLGDKWDFEQFIDLDAFIEKKEHLDALKWSLDWFPEEYGLWQEDSNGNREYVLRRLPLEKVLDCPSPQELEEYVKQRDEEVRSYNNSSSSSNSGGPGFSYGQNSSPQGGGQQSGGQENPFAGGQTNQGGQSSSGNGSDEFSVY